MAFSLKFYEDAGLVTEKTDNLVVTQAEDGSTGSLIFEFFLGSIVAARKFQVEVNPGLDDILLSVVDVSPGAGDHFTDEVKLAKDDVNNLLTAVAGDPLNLGTQLLSGVVNGTAIFVEVDGTRFGGRATIPIGTALELSVETQLLIETDV